ncbi:1-aminocyclopropane-1-carboxylate synthase 7 [Penicillium herquei]|nr:1-aminocyclopropane-1-carboxylate synthase 7 [Penicillium herquei]
MSEKLQSLLPKLAGSHQDPLDGTPTTDLSIAENLLIREKILGMVTEAITTSLKSTDLSYPRGFGEEPELLKALATFFNTYFHPSSAVRPDQIITTSGAGNALDALLCAICDQGDQVLVIGPCWEGFGPYLLIHANVRPIIVQPPAAKTALTGDIVDALQNTLNVASLAPRVHLVWSMSKDFGCSGIRMGCIISQANMALRIGSGLASYWQTSSLANVVARTLLNSPELPGLMDQNAALLRASYLLLADGLSEMDVEYIPVDYGLFLMARVGKYCQDAGDEKDVTRSLAQMGLIVAPGQKFSFGMEFGWVRITFSQPTEVIKRALAIIGIFMEAQENIKRSRRCESEDIN